MRPLVLAMLAVLLLTPIATADGVDHVSPPFDSTIPLGVNSYAAFALDLTIGDLVTADILVESGSAVDVYFTGLEEYRAYVDPDSSGFRYYDALSAAETWQYRESLVSPGGAAATYVLIIDNTANWQPGAVPGGPSTVHVSLRVIPGGVLGAGLNGPAVFAIMVLLMLASAAVGHAVGRRHRGEPDPPPPKDTPTPDGDAGSLPPPPPPGAGPA